MNTLATTRIAGWGNHPVTDGILARPRTQAHVIGHVRDGGPLIARGNGRSYGDPAMGAGVTLSMLHFNRMIAFDGETGVLACEAGLLLSDLLDVFVPRGWFAPVTPGTKYVTLGGMIAADVHGKNHPAAGSLGRHVEWLDLVTADGEIKHCSPGENPDLFETTIGGMGLTGIILRCGVRLLRISTAYMAQHRIVATNLEEVLAAFDDTEGATYRVAWIDCVTPGAMLGRALLDIGEHADLDDLPPRLRKAPLVAARRKSLTLPMTPPFSPINGLTVLAFNELYFRRGAAAPRNSVLSYDSYFYPLDAILHWNRMYGPKGFAQYQCVLPRDTAADGLAELLDEISSCRAGSFLSVLKRLGPRSGLLSFPSEGYTLAIDFPWSDKTAALLDRLDAIVQRHGGHLYLAKDSRVPVETFARLQPRLDDFKHHRTQTGADRVFKSLQSMRLGL